MIRHIPNMLSGLRLLAAPLAAWLILNERDTAALIVFALAGASDGLDGYVARRWGFMSRFGAWLDPVADKLLMLFSLTALYMVGATPVWLATAMASNTGSRTSSRCQGRAPSWLKKASAGPRSGVWSSLHGGVQHSLLK